MASSSLLGKSLTLKNGTVLPNRIVKSAMSEALGTPAGHPSENLVRLYSRWAKGGVGLSITGNVMIDHRALGEPNNVVVENVADQPATQLAYFPILQRWAAAGRQNGGHLWMQINHPGKQAPRFLNREAVAPSAVPLHREKVSAFFEVPRELLEVEIEDLIRRFGATAAIAQKAGFTGVQLHGAHGYLISQFLSPRHNQRKDHWGGTPHKRRNFITAVYREVRARVGPKFSVGIKLNSSDFQRGGFREEESMETVCALGELGFDLVEISGGTYESPVMTGVGSKRKMPGRSDRTQRREAYFLEFCEKVRSQTNVPLLLTGGFRTLKGMSDALESGALDLVGLARPLAIDPELPNRLLAGHEAVFQVVPIHTGIASIDKRGYLEIAWYTRQLDRLSRGLEPRRNESAFFSLGAGLLERTWRGFERRWSLRGIA